MSNTKLATTTHTHREKKGTNVDSQCFLIPQEIPDSFFLCLCGHETTSPVNHGLSQNLQWSKDIHNQCFHYKIYLLMCKIILSGSYFCPSLSRASRRYLNNLPELCGTMAKRLKFRSAKKGLHLLETFHTKSATLGLLPPFSVLESLGQILANGLL